MIVVKYIKDGMSISSSGSVLLPELPPSES